MMMHHHSNKILVAIFHKPGKDDANFEQLKLIFKQFDLFIPRVDFYGNKWRAAKSHFLDNDYDSLFVICSDVSLVCGDITGMVMALSADDRVGVYGFGTIHNVTFSWLRYNNIARVKQVPFIEGYCFGINKQLVPFLELDNVYGYGLDVEMGYKAKLHNLQCIVTSEVCIRHEAGKSYDNTGARQEYHAYLRANTEVNTFLHQLNIFEPL